MTAAAWLIGLDIADKGRLGETICANVMKSSGVHYIPLCQIQVGTAPMAISKGAKTVLPDFDVSGGGVLAYLDAKVKTQSIRYRNTGEVRHGINLSNWEAYLRMGFLQNKQCGLFIVELLDDARQWSGSLLAESFPGLGKPRKGFNETPAKVYWPRNRFVTVGAYSAEEIIEIANGTRQVNMSAMLQTAFAAPPPRCKSHHDPSLWIDDPIQSRHGWIRSSCRKCGGFIGYRPVKPDKKPGYEKH